MRTRPTRSPQRDAVRRDRRRRPVDRGFDRRQGQPLYDFDLAVARLRAQRAALDRDGGGVLLTRAPRVPGRAADLDGNHPPAPGLRDGRGRLPLCARPAHARADRRRHPGGGAQAGEHHHVRARSALRSGDLAGLGAPASASQRARARRLGAPSWRRQGDRRAGPLDAFAGAAAPCRAQCLLSRRHDQGGRDARGGLRAWRRPADRPAASMRLGAPAGGGIARGTLRSVERLDAAHHGESLWEA